jgi:hypothetical protein
MHHLIALGLSHSGILLAAMAAACALLFGMANVPNQAPSLLAASGAVPIVNNAVYHITKAGVAVLTLALPVDSGGNNLDGIEMTFIDEGGHAHTILCGGSPPSGLNAAVGTLTFGGTAGQSVILRSRNGRWWTKAANGVTAS